jgi:hypothetical protein
MAIIRQRPSPPALPAHMPRVLYVGTAADEVCSIVTQHVGEIEIHYESRITEALLVARERKFDTVIVDQRNDDLATKLIVPLISALGANIRLIIVSDFKNVSQYLAVPGVARVLTAPLRAGQLLRVLGLDERQKHFNDRPKHQVAEHSPETAPTVVKAVPRIGVITLFFNHLMSMVSTLYKRAAFILLLALFVAFTFYGFLIGYFLLSSSWAAPMTLTRGHELVNKVERELTELRVAYGQNEQKMSEADLEKETAQQDLKDALVIVNYASGTISDEVKSIERRVKSSTKNLKRLAKVQVALQRQIEKGGMGKELEKLYANRLIDRKTYSAGSMGALEADQRLAMIENEIDQEQLFVESAGLTTDILSKLKIALDEGGPVSSLSASSPELLLLTKQAVDARAAQSMAQSKFKSSTQRRALLEKSSVVLQQQISQIENSTLGRAINERIDVVFVPYSNRHRFKVGTALFSCAFTVIWCDKVGKVGEPLPGEINAVHPFFGKPIRGHFVEAKLSDPSAAAREIIHGVRAPFYF